jgi:hypothetical protein
MMEWKTEELAAGWSEERRREGHPRLSKRANVVVRGQQIVATPANFKSLNDEITRLSILLGFGKGRFGVLENGTT